MPHFDPSKKILALDPAKLTGWAHSDGTSGVWSIGSTDQRLETLRLLILRVEQEKGIKKIACEFAAMGSPSFTQRARHNEHLGVIRQCAAILGVPVVTYAPTSIKKFATGSGKAEKSQMIQACKTFFGITTKSDDEADAIFILAMAEQNYTTNTKAKKRKPPKPRATTSTKLPRKKPGFLF